MTLTRWYADSAEPRPFPSETMFMLMPANMNARISEQDEGMTE